MSAAPGHGLIHRFQEEVARDIGEDPSGRGTTDRQTGPVRDGPVQDIPEARLGCGVGGVHVHGRRHLRAVAEAALDGLPDGAALRALDPGQAVQAVQQVKGLGPFAAELAVLRGANAPDGLPRHERRLDAEIAERYGPGRTLAEVSEAWRPYRTWAAVHLRALREQRTGEIAGR